tara:strand:- start:406 stop:2457 length:2052 start_codon:yes stop_codon:yes gene_type:complete
MFKDQLHHSQRPMDIDSHPDSFKSTAIRGFWQEVKQRYVARIWRRKLTGVLVLFTTVIALANEEDARIVDVTFHSHVLDREKQFTVVKPRSQGKAPVLFLLHGRGRNHRSLVDREATRALLLAEDFYTALPDGEDGWYINSPANPANRYEDYLEEVIKTAEGRFDISREPAQRTIAGWSMGGYGAARFAQSHSSEFAALVGIVGLLDFPREETVPDGQNYKVPGAVFGKDPSVWKSLNPLHGVSRLENLRMLLITGRSAFDRTMNKNFASRAYELGLDCQLVELEGAHTIETVTGALPITLQFVRETFAKSKDHPPTVTKSIKPLPKNRRSDQYSSRDEFLQVTANFETERLRAVPWRFDRENKYFSNAESFSVPLSKGLEIRFRRVRSGRFIDGITPELKNQILDIENRNGDLRRWEDMLDAERRDEVSIDYDFFASETIITNAMFGAFVKETGYRTTVERYETGWIVDSQAQWLQGFANAWDHQIYPMSEPDHPVVQVSWFDAMHFAAWLNEKTGVFFRLPTKEEWLLAARPQNMTDKVCVFPWGNDFDEVAKRMNFGTVELADYMWIHEQFSDGYALSSPVKAFPPNSRGLYDMLGNVWVWNWTSKVSYQNRPFGSRTARPESIAKLGLEVSEHMTMTGGCYLARLSHANLLSRMSHPALDGAEDIGFRLVAVRQRDGGF